MPKVDLKKIEEILTRGVGEFIDPEGSFKAKLVKKQEGKYDKDIIIKFGVDPTRPDIHLGHAVVFRKLRQLQELGCKVVFLIGDFTAQIGDPTGKSKVRPEIAQAEVEKNMQSYLDQIDKILLTGKENSNVFSWISNSDWFISMGDILVQGGAPVPYTNGNQHISLPPDTYMAKTVKWEETRMMGKIESGRIYGVSLRTFLAVLRQITHARLLERDMFQERIKNGDQLYMHEMMYPVLQGIDSHVLARIYGSCDLEVGGTDQTFNILIGRDVMKICGEEERQAVLSFKLLEGLDGKEKMSKSLDNYIAITDSPVDMYGKIMSLPDSLITKYFELTTDVPLEEIKKYEAELNKGKNPRDIKMDLAFAITSIYHGKNGASKGADHFHTVFQQKEKPHDIIELKPSTMDLITVLVEAKICKSKSEARQVIAQGGVKINDKKAETIDEKVKSGDVIQKGSRFFVKIK